MDARLTSFLRVSTTACIQPTGIVTNALDRYPWHLRSDNTENTSKVMQHSKIAPRSALAHTSVEVFGVHTLSRQLLVHDCFLQPQAPVPHASTRRCGHSAADWLLGATTTAHSDPRVPNAPCIPTSARTAVITENHSLSNQHRHQFATSSCIEPQRW